MERITSCQTLILSSDLRPDQQGECPLRGDPEWMVDNPHLVTLIPTHGGRLCNVIPKGPLGVVSVFLKALADFGMGQGVQPVYARKMVEILPGEIPCLQLPVVGIQQASLPEIVSEPAAAAGEDRIVDSSNGNVESDNVETESGSDPDSKVDLNGSAQSEQAITETDSEVESSSPTDSSEVGGSVQDIQESPTANESDSPKDPGSSAFDQPAKYHF